MPNFNFRPPAGPVAPVWDEEELKQKEQKNQRMTRAEFNKAREKSLGPVGKVLNAWMSPDFLPGLITGPVNAASKFGNMMGDIVQGKPVDVSDAWQIKDEQVRRNNPLRYGPMGQGAEVTPADEPGLRAGETVGGAFGAVLGGELLLGAAPVASLSGAVGRTAAWQAVRSTPVVGRAAGLVARELPAAAVSVPLLDQSSNLANVGDPWGLNLPLRVEKDDDYLTASGKGLVIDGVLTPLAVLAPLGAAWRRWGPGANAVADVATEAAPQATKGVPDPWATGAGVPDPWPSSAGLGGNPQVPDPWGDPVSATSRATREQTQLRQVADQRRRLQEMGLLQQGEGRQLEFTLDAGVDPEIKLQVRQLQTERGQLLRQAREEGVDVTTQLGQIDQQIGDLIQAGRSQDAMDARPPVQPELDFPDGRPELDTYLAHLDELSDAELRDLHSRVWRDDADVRLKQEQETLAARVQEIQQEISSVDAPTEIGRKRKLTKLEKALAQAQQELVAMEGRRRVPESLVGDQLELRMSQQLSLDLSEQVKVPPLREITGTASEFNYRTPNDYRSALQGWNRDTLRQLAMPNANPEVAALVKLRTGRRVWQAKKQDIIDALVEISERSGRYLPPEVEQLGLELKSNPLGGDAPLLDRPADLSAADLVKTVDADGNEVVVPAVDYAPRGMDSATREELKSRILQKAVWNGEVQPPFSPLPERPAPQFSQGDFAAQLLADESGQLPLMYANDMIEPYKAGGKSAEALIDEMRLRFDYKLIDAQAEQWLTRLRMDEAGWATKSWEAKKTSGLLEEGVFPMKAEAVPDSPGNVAPPSKANTYEWTPGRLLSEEELTAIRNFENTEPSKRMVAEAEELRRAELQQVRIMQKQAALQGKALDNQIAKIEELIARGQCNG